MSNYLQSLTVAAADNATAARPAISGTESLAPPAASDTAGVFEQHVIVEAAPSARPIPSASLPSPHAPSAAPDAPQPGHGAAAASNLDFAIEEVVRWVQAPRPAPNAVGPRVRTSQEAADQPRPRASTPSDVDHDPRLAAINAQPAPQSQPGALPEERVMVAARPARTLTREDARLAPRVPAAGRHADTGALAVASARPEHAVEVHIGSIALTVKAPPPPVAPFPAHAAAAAPQAPKREARPSGGPRFSASRHYLRWS